MLEWSSRSLGAPLNITAGVVPIAQPYKSLERLTAAVHGLSPFGLVALYDLVGMSGSLVLGLAAIAEIAPAEEIWSLSRIDEDWQAEQWGTDEEADAVVKRKRDDFLHAFHFWTFCANGE
jgi:chaperone required for assembly of F1-ATPase